MRNPQIEADRATLRAKQHAYFEAFAPHAKVSRSTDSAFLQLRSYSGEMIRLARETAAKVRELQDNDVMNPEGRDRLLRETKDRAASTLRQLKERQEGALTVLQASLRVTAMPKVLPDREMPTRDEARMILDASPDPVTAMLEMAERGGELATVVSGSWGESYLRARSVREAPRRHSDVQTAAIGASAMSTDPALSAAGKAYFAVRDAKMGADASYHLAADEMADVGAAG